MSQGMSEIIHRLKTCFPRGYMNFNNEFIAHRQANRNYGCACCALRNCTNAEEVICAAIESFSYDCCKSRPFKSSDVNIDFRQYMIDGMNDFLGTAFTENEFATIYVHLGNRADRQLTLLFVDSGYNVQMLRSRRQERLVSADKLLKIINGLEYKARTLEQTRGGNDVLRKLVPKLIEDAATVRIMTITHCWECKYWTGEDDGSSEYGYCSRYKCSKEKGGYCDVGRKKTESE